MAYSVMSQQPHLMFIKLLIDSYLIKPDKFICCSAALKLYSEKLVRLETPSGSFITFFVFFSVTCRNISEFDDVYHTGQFKHVTPRSVFCLFFCTGAGVKWRKKANTHTSSEVHSLSPETGLCSNLHSL